jgi:hypothetical protein
MQLLIVYLLYQGNMKKKTMTNNYLSLSSATQRKVKENKNN